MRRVWIIGALVVFAQLSAPLAAESKNANRIGPYPKNPCYWQYKSEPVMLLGASKTDHLFLIDDLKAHLDLDGYHVMAMINKKVEKVRAEDTRQLNADGYEPILTNSRCCVLKRAKNLTQKQTTKVSELMKYDLPTMRGYLMKEGFQRFWIYRNVTRAGKFLSTAREGPIACGSVTAACQKPHVSTFNAQLSRRCDESLFGNMPFLRNAP